MLTLVARSQRKQKYLERLINPCRVRERKPHHTSNRPCYIQHNRSSISTITRGWTSVLTANNENDEDNERFLIFRGIALQQVRWKRRDGNKAFSRERPPTKKQMKRYNRKLGALDEKHGTPGSKAGSRRVFDQVVKKNIMDPPAESAEDDIEYGMGDALLDDLIGNTSYLTAQPTPEPVYLGHKHKTFFNRVRNQMKEYQRKIDLLVQNSGEENQKALLDLEHVELPTDNEISLVLRSFRDRYGTKRNPVGVVKALEHLVKDLEVPMTSLDELSWTALITCSANPEEGRRVIKIMTQQGQDISSYSWSILADLYSKAGDFAGCQRIHDEMIASGVAPTLPSYTSLISVCARVCSNGRVAHSVRAEAGRMGWEAWQEMQVSGIDADVMAFGAILQLAGARGHPERALNLLEEMQVQDIKPTTLCFTNALRAVAKSHAVAVRYERGGSRRNMRRESIAAHHGKMARQIVIHAESAEVVQDEGFVAALIMCAAEAGDAATAKAIYTASQIRGLTEFRTIGSDDHLRRLRGDSAEVDSLGLLTSTGSEITSTASEISSYEEREHGKDSRTLTAILHACARAVDKNGIGDVWQGRENKGYLCENSLRLIQARRLPRYVDQSIPGQKRTDNLTWRAEKYDDDYRSGKRKPRKFTGVEEDPDVGVTLDELDDEFERIYVDREGKRREEYRATSFEDIWKKKYGNDGTIDENLEDGQETLQLESKSRETLQLESKSRDHKGYPSEAPHEQVSKVYSGARNNDLPRKETHFDFDTMKWKDGPAPVPKPPIKTDSKEKIKEETLDNLEEEELYFDRDEMKWKSRPISRAASMELTEYERNARATDSNNNETNLSDDTFKVFFSQLKDEVKARGAPTDDISEDEARDIFESMKEEYSELLRMDTAMFEEELGNMESSADDVEGREDIENDTKQDFVDFVENIKDEWRNDGSTPMILHDKVHDVEAPWTKSEPAMQLEQEPTVIRQQVGVLEEKTQGLYHEANRLEEASHETPIPRLQEDGIIQDRRENSRLEREGQSGSLDDVERLREFLPGLPSKRLKKILATFKGTLGDPSLLDLSLVVREHNPDYITNTWLKQASARASRFVMRNAERQGLVDQHMLNGVLEVECASGSLERALQFHRASFLQYDTQPNDYSNRLILQMLVRSRRFHRAMSFKSQIEEGGGHLDLHSYGSLVEYCSKHDQVGSAHLLLKECIQIHGAPPNEASLKHLRTLCRRDGLEDAFWLNDLIGKDPTNWLRHGERHYKREMSRKGRLMVNYARNRLLQV